MNEHEKHGCSKTFFNNIFTYTLHYMRDNVNETQMIKFSEND